MTLASCPAREVRRWPRGYGYLSDQVTRAIASCVLNMAEGNARLSPAERRRFFQIARASLAEVGACIDLAKTFFLSSGDQSELWKEECHQISKMLFRLW